MIDSSIRLGILDTVPAEFYLDGEKSDPQKFIDMFERVDAPMMFRTYAATAGRFPDSLNECDAYLITGSPCSVYGKYGWINDLENFIRQLDTAEIPLVGICFGHQAIAQALGGTVRRADNGWTLGLHDFEVATEKKWMTGSTSDCALYFINQDQVQALPPDVELLAGSNHCPNAMFQREGRVLSIQGHPEQPLASMKRFLELLVNEQDIDKATAERAATTMAGGEPDADLFATWISQFLISSLRLR